MRKSWSRCGPTRRCPCAVSALPCPAVWSATLSKACEVSPSYSCCQGFGLFRFYRWIPAEVIILWSHCLIAEERAIHILLEYLVMYRVVTLKPFSSIKRKPKGDLWALPELHASFGFCLLGWEGLQCLYPSPVHACKYDFTLLLLYAY